jgi:TolB-like protein
VGTAFAAGQRPHDPVSPVSFLDELKRRRVVRVAAVYCATAFAVIQAADVIFPRVALPAWTVTLVVWLAILGLPVAAIMAWLFQVTPEGVRLTDTPEPAGPAAPHTRWFGARALLAIGAMLVLGIGLGAGWFLKSRTPAPDIDTAGIRMLAVSQFVNLTGDSAQIFLAQGITDQLIAGLTQIGSLRVITLHDGAAALDKARGRGIDVDVVLNGSLQRAGQVVRITAQLNSARTGEALWARSFTGELLNILNLQDSVMRAVADTLRVALSSADRSRLNAVKRQIDPQAYEAFVRGDYFLGKVSEANFRKAIGLFQQAIDHEPFYADAYARLAYAYSELAYYTIEPPDNVYPKVRSAALKAIQIDSANDRAYASLARYHVFTWDFVAAERYYRRAIELNPRAYHNRFAYETFLAVMNRPREAIAQGKIAVELDPLNLLNVAAAARPFYNARRYPEAIAQAKRALEIDSTFSRAHYWIGMAHEQMGHHREAIQEFEQTIRSAGPMPVYAAALAHAYVVAGRTHEGRQMLATLEKRALTSYVSPVDLAMIYAALGDKEKAFRLLEEGYRRHDVVLITMYADPRFDTLRSDPRWTELTRRIGFPQS